MYIGTTSVGGSKYLYNHVSNVEQMQKRKRMQLQNQVVNALQQMTNNEIKIQREHNAAHNGCLVSMMFFDVCAELVLRSRR